MRYIESDTLMFVSVVALLGWIIWLNFRGRQQLTELKRMQLQLLTSALEKFGVAAEFTAFLQSHEGQAILCDGESPNKGPRRTNIRFVQAGILLAFAGAGLFLCASRYSGTPGGDLVDVLAMLNFTGTVAISTGVGLFVVAAVTFLWERWLGNPANDRQ